MTTDERRLLLALEQRRKLVNRETINPEIRTLELGEIEPILKMVAEVRAAYVSELFALAERRDGLPNTDDIALLAEHRVVYEELISAANALETMIERGYLDVDSLSS